MTGPEPAGGQVARQLAAWRERADATLARLLDGTSGSEPGLHAAMRHAVLLGGKRMRPLLAYASGHACGAGAEVLDAPAAAVELIHAYSLVHDDLPCMDDDVLRRGKATCHVAFDEATALLAGDALQTQAFAVLAAPELGVEPARQLDMLRLLAHASGPLGMAGGQAIDLASVGQALNLPQLEFMHALKTGALIRASVLLGALAGEALPAEQMGRLDHFSRVIGLAFQVVDDVLDCEADSATLGKTAGKDAAHDKPTYVSLLGLAEARRMARELRDQAFAALEPFGARAERLRALADYIVVRSF